MSAGGLRPTRTRRRRASDPLVVTKRLVAHVTEGRPESFGVPYGPADGDAVGVPAPCARLLAGYWCGCGSGFASTTTGEETFRARVVAADDGVWRGWVDDGFDSDGWMERPVHRPGDADRRALQQAVEALEIGTVVERLGAFVAPAFGWVPASRCSTDGSASSGGGYPW